MYIHLCSTSYVLHWAALYLLFSLKPMCVVCYVGYSYSGDQIKDVWHLFCSGNMLPLTWAICWLCRCSSGELAEGAAAEEGWQGNCRFGVVCTQANWVHTTPKLNVTDITFGYPFRVHIGVQHVCYIWKILKGFSFGKFSLLWVIVMKWAAKLRNVACWC